MSDENNATDVAPQPSQFDLRQREIQEKADETYTVLAAYFEQLKRERGQ